MVIDYQVIEPRNMWISNDFTKEHVDLAEFNHQRW